MKARIDQLRRIYERKIDELEQQLLFYKCISISAIILMLVFLLIFGSLEN